MSAFAAIQTITNVTVPEDTEVESDDDIAFREAKERGMTDDDKTYFRHLGYPV